MNVAINTLAHVTGGGITYLENVLPRLADDGNQYVVLLPAGRGKVTRPEASNLRFIETTLPVEHTPVRLLYEQVVLPALLWYWDVDVLLSPADLTPLLAPCPAVLAVRNPNPYFDAPGIDRPLAHRLKFRLQRYLTWLSARKADAVFFVSEFSRQTANRYLNVPAAKTAVIHHGIDPELFTDPAEPGSSLRETVESVTPYLLCVSTINEHKNYETLLGGYARLSPALRDQYDLVIAGRNSTPEYFQRLKAIVDQEGIAERVHFLGDVPYEHVPYLYDNATVYVLPSKLETFGHTLVEAMASETAIAAADSTCIPEITAGAAELFDPDDPDDLAVAVETLVSDGERRDELVARGRNRVAAFSWDRAVAETKDLLRRVHEWENDG